MELKFLLTRLIFLISIEAESAEIIKSDGIEKCFRDETTKPTESDDSSKGKVIIELLRYRYNLVHNNLYGHAESKKESEDFLGNMKISSNNVNLIGTSLNIFLAKGPENVSIKPELLDKFMSILELFLNLYKRNENRDYFGSILLISLKFDDSCRGELRKRFLPSPNNTNSK